MPIKVGRIMPVQLISVANRHRSTNGDEEMEPSLPRFRQGVEWNVVYHQQYKKCGSAMSTEAVPEGPKPGIIGATVL